MSSLTPAEQALAIELYKKSLVPLYVCLPSLTWVVLDYFDTLHDEVRYIWPQRRNVAKFAYLWVRYYTIALLIFDVTQIHLFTRRGITSNSVCVSMDLVTRLVGAILLWGVEIILQLRVFALYVCSRKVALFNAVLFFVTVGAFLGIMIVNTKGRLALIEDATGLGNSCPSVHGGLEWATWIPPSVFEFVLFLFAVGKTITTGMSRFKQGGSGVSILAIVCRDNLLYFFAITAILILNTIMAAGSTSMPWFSYAPFHAAIGIMTSRMLMHLRKATLTEDSLSSSRGSRQHNDNFIQSVHFAHSSSSDGDFVSTALPAEFELGVKESDREKYGGMPLESPSTRASSVYSRSRRDSSLIIPLSPVEPFEDNQDEEAGDEDICEIGRITFADKSELRDEQWPDVEVPKRTATKDLGKWLKP